MKSIQATAQGKLKELQALDRSVLPQILILALAVAVWASSVRLANWQDSPYEAVRLNKKRA